ncbi:UspA domain protein [Natrinema pellirubrum DSM 15624]|uniref:Universal stress family protein n=1 Tax=Natrinema pellirubrum (strain DSM 15624 / CIP 106293 / JCM 10476 / NCIMB 786 / 157) TaxID=797303 RepID=L0JUB6_NATP1|nr:universal stress family protein [Natrinema pellirubrum DSM 15624]ELY69176.1 UspA domain protein [Natrinema pellirubrum DSM 15624]
MATRALRYALEVHPSAEVTVLHVAGDPSGMMGKVVGIALEDDIQQAAEDAAEVVLAQAREIAKEYDTDIETDVGWGSPAKVIVKRAGSVDAVVLGSHAGSLADRLFVGDIAKNSVSSISSPGNRRPIIVSGLLFLEWH